MIPFVKRNPVQFPSKKLLAEPPGLIDDKLFGDYDCKQSVSEKDCHVPSLSMGDILANPSDSSGSSYHTALCSEGTESFKDCVESFEDDVDRLLTSSPANGLEPASPSELSSAAVKYFLASPSEDKAEQLPGERPGLSDKASHERPDRCSEGDDSTSAAASTTGTHSISCGSQASGAFLAVTDKRPQSQANSMHAPSHQVCRDQSCYSDKENQQVQMSVMAKNSSAPVYSVRMGLVTRELQPGDTGSKYLDQPLPFNSQRSGGMFLCARQMKKPSRVPVSSKPACPQYCAEFSSAVSDSDEADNEVQKLTALSFRSLSCPHGSYLDMYSSSNRASSSLSNSLSEDSNGINRWSTCHDLRKAEVLNPAKGSRQFPTASQAPEKDQLNNTCRKEQFECIDVVLDNADSRQSHSKKRTVPKRQIQLKQKDRKDMNFLARGESTAQQGFLPLRKDSCTKGRIISDEFRINYKQFMRTASLNDSYSKTQMASCLVKNVLAKKMQYEQKIKMEQKSMQGSSTSSAPSSVSTDLMGDFMEQKSSSLSKSDCSYSGEDMQSHSTSEKSESVAMSQDSMDALRPTKGVVLNKQLRENVCKLKKTFNELNERMKYQDVLQSKRLPILADGVNEGSKNKKQVAGKRKEYQKARALFESQQADPKGVDTTPSFSKTQKPWPNLKQRAIKPNKQMSWKEEKSPFEPESLAVPSKTSRNTFTSKTQEMKLMPQAKNEEKTLTVSRHLTPDGSSEGKVPAAVHSIKQSSLILPTSGKPCDDRKTSCPEASHIEETKETRSKGKGRIHQPRDVRKLVKNTYSLCFKSSDVSQIVQYPCEETNNEDLATKEPTATSPLFIHCTSIQRKDATPTLNQSHGKDSDVSVHSMQDQGAREDLHGTSLNPTIKPHMNMPVKVTESKGAAVAESPVHITKIQSKKKVVAGNEEPQQKTENKPVPYEKSKLNVTHSSAAMGKPPQKESQLNIKVKSSLSKQPHRTEAPSYSALEGKAVKDFSSQANFSLLEDSKASASERTLPPSACPKEETKRRRDIHFNTTIPGHLLEAYRSKKPHLALQKHASNEIISLTPLDSKDLSASPEEKSKVSEPEPTNESHRYLQPVKPTVTSAPQSYANTPIKNNFVNNALHQETESKMLDALKPPGSQVFVPEYGMSPESAYPNTPYRSREYSEGTRPPSSPSAEPLPPSGKLQESRDHLSKRQATNEQYFTAAQAENANYLTIPTKGQISEPTPTLSGVSNPDSASFSSNVSFQPGGEASASKMSDEPSQPKAPEGKADTDHSKSSPPSHVHPSPRRDESPNFMRRSDSSFPCGKSAASPTRPFAPHSHVHRKMLIDPDSGKCYYMEPPRQPQLKMLYDPETGQYIEVLIPPVPLASHSGLYQSPFNPLVMNPGVYGPSYMPYSGFPAFPLPPPPVAMPPTHSDLQNQQPTQESTNFNATFSHVPKSEAPPLTQASDCSYMESLYYIPTGMNSSPNPNQPLFFPATSSSPSVPEKGPMFRM